MRKLWILVALSLTFSIGTHSADASSNVSYVYDGDTLTLANGDKVRLVQIDAPELSPAECYGKEASEILKELIGSSRVTLIKEPLAGNRDSFGRLLRYVKISSKNINLEMVKRGAAAPWFYNGQKGKFNRELLAAARTAQKNKVGLWKACPSTELDPNRSIDTGPALKSNKDNSSLDGQDKVEQGITPGAFCSENDAGKMGLSKKGLQYICKTSANEQRLRWRR